MPFTDKTIVAVEQFTKSMERILLRDPDGRYSYYIADRASDPSDGDTGTLHDEAAQQIWDRAQTRHFSLASAPDRIRFRGAVYTRFPASQRRITPDRSL